MMMMTKKTSSSNSNDNKKYKEKKKKKKKKQYLTQLNCGYHTTALCGCIRVNQNRPVFSLLAVVTTHCHIKATGDILSRNASPHSSHNYRRQVM